MSQIDDAEKLILGLADRQCLLFQVHPTISWVKMPIIEIESAHVGSKECTPLNLGHIACVEVRFTWRIIRKKQSLLEPLRDAIWLPTIHVDAL